MKIASEIQLPGFIQIDKCQVNIRIRRINSVFSTDCMPQRVIVERIGKGDFLYTCPYEGLKYKICDGKDVIISSSKSHQNDLLRLPFYGFVIATVLHQNDFFVLHASAIEIDGKAVVVIGGKGDGKSTLITALTNRGHRLISDDVTALAVQSDKISVLPGIPCIKIWPDTLLSLGLNPKDHPQLYPESIKRNYFVAPEMHCSVERELGAIFVLDHDERLELLSLQTIQKMLWLSGGCYCARFEDAFTLVEKKRMFEMCSYYAKRVKMARLIRPNDLNLLEKTCDLIEDYMYKTEQLQQSKLQI